MNKLLYQDSLEEMKLLKTKGFSINKIARKLNLCHETIRQYLMSDEEKQKFREKRNLTQKNRKKNNFTYRIKQSLLTIKNHAKTFNYKECISSSIDIKNAFDGKCKICDISELECKKSLSIDHDHITGEFRGWLCDRCNKTLGLLNDDVNLLNKMIAYLGENNG